MATLPRQFFVLATLAAAALAPAACSDGGSGQSSDGGSGQSTATRAAEIAACPLLSPAEIETVVGSAMGDGKERDPTGGGENQGRMTACTWEAASGDPGAAFVTLLVWSWPAGSGGGGNYLESFRQAARDYDDLPEPEPVTLGEEALWDGTAIHVRSGDVSFDVAVGEKGLAPATSKEEAQALAEVVLGRLPSS